MVSHTHVWITNKLLVEIPVDEHWTYVTHPVLGGCRFLNKDYIELLHLLRNPSTTEQLADQLDFTSAHLDVMIEHLHLLGFIHRYEFDEEQEVASRLRSAIHCLQFTGYPASFFIGSALLSSSLAASQTAPLKVLLLGNCYADRLVTYLEQAGNNRGFVPKVEVSWPDEFNALTGHSFDLVLYQPFNVWLLRTLFDDWLNCTKDEKASTVTSIKEYLSGALTRIEKKAGKSLVIVQGLVTPSLSPNPEEIYLIEDCVRDLNEHLRNACRAAHAACLLDTNHLFSRFGTQLLLDDIVAPISHQTPLLPVGPSYLSPSVGLDLRLFDRPNAFELLANEAFDLYIRWSSRGQIKLIVIDLDGTLWDGQAADPHFSLTNQNAYERFRYGIFGGIHQALQWLKQQGILLATCSKNDEENVMSHWEMIAPCEKPGSFAVSASPDWTEDIRSLDMLLRPDDFVAHHINWRPKSDNIRELTHKLGFSFDSVLFIDDNPIELAEVQNGCPGINLLGPNMDITRYTLLTDPRLHPINVTEEGRRRTETTRALIKRQETLAIHTSTSDFLKKLHIHLHIFRVAPDAPCLGRISELINRTNQFKTTDLVVNHSGLQDWLRQQGTVLHALEVTDRFSKYGIVGACLVMEQEIVQLVLSCRVIGLEVAVPFLVESIRGLTPPFSARILPTARNPPCHNVFREAGFVSEKKYSYHLEKIDQLSIIDKKIYNFC